MAMLVAAAFAQAFAAILVLVLALPRTSRAWGDAEDVPATSGYRTAALCSVVVPRVPSQLLFPAFAAILLGLTGGSTMLASWLLHVHDADHWLVRAAAVELLACACLATAVLLRANLARHAQPLGVVTTTLGCLVGLPAIAWPRWFDGGSFAIPALLGLVSIGAGLALVSLASAARRAELEALARDRTA